MRDYSFTLRFRLPSGASDPEAHLPAILAAGCDDATVGIGRPGRLALMFTREARNARGAIGSAIRAIQRAIPGIRLVEVGPDYVGISEIGEVLGISRQAARKMIEASDDFPDPLHEGTSATYRLATVLAWCATDPRRSVRVDSAMLEVAREALRLNVVREAALLS